MSTHLVIPDSHANPDFNNNRFTWLGKLIVDVKPDVVIDMGDMADMQSLCSYDKGTQKAEGRRYIDDINSYIDANGRIFDEIRAYNKKNKKKAYKPRMVKLRGNHEHRIIRAADKDPTLFGKISYDDLRDKQFGWEVHEFLEPVVIDGVAYCHYFTSGVLGKPIGGINPARSLLNKGSISATQGHVHTFDYAESTRFDGQKIQGLVCGCYVDYHADYAGQANNMWRSGIVIKRGVKDGVYDLEWISIERMEQLYS